MVLAEVGKSIRRQDQGGLDSVFEIVAYHWKHTAGNPLPVVDPLTVVVQEIPNRIGDYDFSKGRGYRDG